MNLINRIKAPVPRLFKTIRNVALALAAVGTTLLTVPVALPAVLLKIAGYLTVAGAVAASVSQVTTDNDTNSNNDVPAS
jgi:hypothetical protein